MTPGLLGHPALREADVIQVGEFHQLATLFASIAAREAAIPLVAWQETFRPMRFPGSFYQRFYNRSLGRHVLKTASRFVPRTTKARTYLKELGVRDADITSWIPTGVDLDTFAPMKSRYLPEDFGFKTDTKILLVVARLQRDKGVDIALRVTKQLSRDYPNIGLIVAGEGPERANLHRLAKDLGISESVRLVGQVPREELVHLCNAADIVLSTSRNDLLPIALIEASACGCPCIVTDIGAIRDIVVDGVTGIVVQERRIDAFSEAILSTLRDDALRIAYGNAARNRMELHFSLPKIAENLLEVYRNACN
ncbi:MAG: glycosyltransferase [Anaerolineae bacterium]|nr:glycosyltransferase [Anaerolineae bacterium]